MDDIEFKPYDNENLKKIGTQTNNDKQEDKKRDEKSPRNFKYLIIILIAIIGLFTFHWYQNKFIYPKHTKIELSEIRNALYHYKESFDAYPNQLTELAKGRPLRESWSTDAWGNSYRYEVNESKQFFIVTSPGYDGKFNTDDDIQVK